jgi:hypothetical protein
MKNFPHDFFQNHFENSYENKASVFVFFK